MNYSLVLNSQIWANVITFISRKLCDFCFRDQYFALAVVRGVLELRYNLGTGPAVIKTKTRVNTGKEIEVNFPVISGGKTTEKAWVKTKYRLALAACLT
jgi:hypothetical protein